MAVKGKSLQCVNYIHGKCSTSHSISLHLINEMVLAHIEDMFEDELFELEIRQDAPKCDIEVDITALIERERLKLKRVAEAYEDGVYDLQEFKERKKLVENQIQQLKAKEKELNPKAEDEKKIKQEFIKKHKTIPQLLRSPNLTEKEKNTILHDFVSRITFNRTTGTIKIFFCT